jgi:flavin-dependent dehydrogenase
MADRSASVAEFMPWRVPEGHYDVAVLGGGLAGLSMGLQLKRARPDTRVLVAEKRLDPPREAAFKVGESSVENGAHYYREVLGMRDHLEERQIRKLGLRFFLPAGDNSDITKRVEFCTPAHHAAFTHQIDRGRFENELFNRCIEHGADAVRGFRVQDVTLGEDRHTVVLGHDSGETTVTARWVVDATGRGNFLRKKLGIGTETGHHINAAWFRLAGGLDFEAWTDDEEWLGRMPERGLRLYSTTHLIDEGYWLWLIQLASGPISIGVCADPRFHPFEEINSFDGMVQWMYKHEPQLAAEVDGRRGDVQDFLRIEDFSYASSRVFSADRWVLAGEAAGFVDALYSPGSDFIGYTNTFGGELIVRELDGEDVSERVEFYNDFFFRLFNTTVALYKDNYQFFGNPQIMVAKVVFDSLVYFTTLASPFVHGRMLEVTDIEQLLEHFEGVLPWLTGMQQLFRDWHALDQRQWEGVSALSKQLMPYIRAQEEIGLPAEGDLMIERAIANIETIKAVAVWIFHKAAENLDERPAEDVPINPGAVSLHPERWEQDGLFAGDGMTLVRARELLVGIEEMDLEARGAALGGPLDASATTSNGHSSIGDRP